MIGSEDDGVIDDQRLEDMVMVQSYEKGFFLEVVVYERYAFFFVFVPLPLPYLRRELQVRRCSTSG